MKVKNYLVADPYGCPVHQHGHPSTERRCSCKFFWTNDPHDSQNIICPESDSIEVRNSKIKKYENQ